ncbi:MAG: hypothetical protein P4M09_23710 [Devosia sp.]|nr:hypothetical protein [Devosia sp.]
MNPGEAFADELAARAVPALTGAGGHQADFSIGRVTFRLLAPFGGHETWLGRALMPSTGYPEGRQEEVHQLFAWDGSDPSAFPPNRPWGPVAHEPVGVVADYTTDKVRCAFDIHTGSLIVYDYRRNASYTWLPSIAEMPAWAKASPFRIALSWLLNRHGMQMVHGAAVAVDGRGVLLAGAGGAGKSTTALACALSGMGYLGDDYCAVDPADCSVHAIYRTAKVLPTTLAMLPRLAPLLVNADRIGSEKGVIFFDGDAVDVLASARLSAILVPRIGGEPGTTLSPASHQDVMKALLPSTIGGTMGGTQVTAKLILQLVHGLPGYFLNVGTDLERVTAAVAGQLLVH